ncbi:MAG TPA: thiamine-phosphate kinase [Longimicrobiaceae bacterium]|nr:thiamine-phosphate kinase [Longimicrobiaceae bacterium]
MTRVPDRRRAPAKVLPPLGPGAEFDLVRRFLERASAAGRADVRVGPGDDCAVVAGDGIALSSDLSVEGVHFRRDWLSFREIGSRAAAAALSDLAAVAARPIGVLASLALPQRDAGTHAVQLMEGVRRSVEHAGGTLLGGDLARSPGPLTIDIVAVGECARPVLRSGAASGDEVWVTGELGAAAAYVEQRLEGTAADPAARARYARPEPRVHEARWLAERGLPSAALDLSDGLAGDAAHLSAASGVAILLVPDLIPIHPAARRHAADGEAALRLALAGGEDYELCFTAAPGRVELCEADFERTFGVRLTCVGRAAGGDGVWWVDAEGHRRPLELRGYRHFEEGGG